MLRQAKLWFLKASDVLGVSSLVLNSSWRQQRLPFLCFHGTSLDDEHEWNGGLYITADQLRRRMKIVRDTGCHVLSLPEAVGRLYEGSLPKRSVVITFDDGSYDFYKLAFPIVHGEFGFPLTLYYTTYYSEFNRPVFDTMCSYLLWKARGIAQPFTWPEILPQPINLADGDSRLAAVLAIKASAIAQRLSGRDKDLLLANLAERLGIDYEALCRKRLLHLITPDEACEMAAQGLDIQYHTHRHREYRRQERFHRELDDNRVRIEAVTPVVPRHFCYTGGFHLPDFPEFLRAYGIVSATTCEAGIGSRQSDPLMLPRYLDSAGVTDAEFRSWLTGIAAMIPARQYPMSEGQLGVDDDEPTVSTGKN